MKCKSCPCTKYVPDEDLVLDAWKMALGEKDWDAAYFDDHELCLECRHTPAEHGDGGGSEEANVVSAVHITESGETKPFVKSVDVGRYCLMLRCVGCSSFSDVGLQLWRCSVLMAEYLVEAYKSPLEGSIAWEVGAGVGLPGLLLGKMGWKVWASDVRDTVVANLEEEVRVNGLEGAVEVKEFGFEHLTPSNALQKSLKNWTPADTRASVHLLTMSDVIFAADTTNSLLAFLAATLAAPHPPRCLIAYDKRTGQAITATQPPLTYFLSNLPKHSLAYTDIDTQSIPQSCSAVSRTPDCGILEIFTAATHVA